MCGVYVCRTNVNDDICCIVCMNRLYLDVKHAETFFSFKLFKMSGSQVTQPPKLRNKTEVRSWLDLALKTKEESIAKTSEINVLNEQVSERDKRIAELEAEVARLREHVSSLQLTAPAAAEARLVNEAVNDPNEIDVETVEDVEVEVSEIDVDFFEETDDGFRCKYCENFTSIERFKVRAHIKNNCKGVPREADHKCPVCDSCFTYDGLRMHINPFVGRRADENIKKATTNHHNKSKRFHEDLKTELIEAKKRAKINKTPYISIFPIN